MTQPAADEEVCLPTTSRPERPEKETVLVVDDDVAILQTFARMLRLRGYAVRTAASAETGVQEAEACRPDAILLDLQMPFVDGLECLRRLRATESLRSVPVMVITGDYFMDDTTAADLASLGAAVQFKPVWVDDLAEIVEKLVASGSHARR
jgi:CheY-like chemotaxis protein